MGKWLTLVFTKDRKKARIEKGRRTHSSVFKYLCTTLGIDPERNYNARDAHRFASKYGNWVRRVQNYLHWVEKGE